MSTPEDDWLLGPGDYADEPPEPDDVALLVAKLAEELSLQTAYLTYALRRNERFTAMCRQIASRLKQAP